MSLLEGVTRKNVTEDNIPREHKAIKLSLGLGGKLLFRTSKKPFTAVKQLPSVPQSQQRFSVPWWISFFFLHYFKKSIA